MFSKQLIVCVLLLVYMYASVSAEKFLSDLESKDIRVVRYRLEEEKEKRLLLQNDLEILMLKVAKLERSISADVSDKCPDNRSKTPQVVAFHASFSKGHLDIAKGTTLVFDRVLSNQGGGYSSSTGTFRAPVDGTYYFSLHLLASGSKTMHNGIFKNSERVGNTYAAATGSQSVVLDLKTGDEVFVKAYVNGMAHGANYCAFSGFRIN